MTSLKSWLYILWQYGKPLLATGAIIGGILSWLNVHREIDIAAENIHTWSWLMLLFIPLIFILNHKLALKHFYKLSMLKKERGKIILLNALSGGLFAIIGFLIPMAILFNVFNKDKAPNFFKQLFSKFPAQSLLYFFLLLILAAIYLHYSGSKTNNNSQVKN